MESAALSRDLSHRFFMAARGIEMCIRDSNIIYQAEGCYYSAWNVISSLDEFERLFGNNKAYYCAPEYFKYVAVSEYMLVEAEKYSYRIAFCNDYYRKALNNVWNTMG